MPHQEPAASVALAPCFDVVTVRGYTDRSGEERAAYTRIGNGLASRPRRL